MAIGRTEDRDTPRDPVMPQHRKNVRNPIRVTHLGQWSIMTAHTGRTHDRNRPDPSQLHKTLATAGAVHTWVPAFAGTTFGSEDRESYHVQAGQPCRDRHRPAGGDGGVLYRGARVSGESPRPDRAAGLGPRPRLALCAKDRPLLASVLHEASSSDARWLGEKLARWDFEMGAGSLEPLLHHALLRELERAVLDAGGVVLRYGFFYGPGSAVSRTGSFGADLTRRRLPLVGGGRGVWSFIHVDDAACHRRGVKRHSGADCNRKPTYKFSHEREGPRETGDSALRLHRREDAHRECKPHHHPRGCR